MKILPSENTIKFINRDGASKVGFAVILGQLWENVIDWIENPKVF